ncbi:DUF3575 domain-containing protein [Bacteroides sp. 51]|uniref:DUF3575 domain-containing protein n=1 Tax=Bacteroides sp. 51 TaxID=2302938 RepID=UPI0013D5C6E2|nr:DUF3575 domain-containing protein [Bacteroides sp. 51]NDV82846.1 DUF3575 domain-containing protein [Bacteroides sp. 51]
MSDYKGKTNFSIAETLRLLCGVILVWGGSIHGMAAKDAVKTASGGDFIEISFRANPAHAPDTLITRTARIYYRVNRTEIDKNYMGNAHTLNAIDQLFANITLKEEDFIAITGGASPEGGFYNNQRLSVDRALSLRKYIIQKYPQIKEHQVVILPDGEDWDGLIGKIEKDKNVPARDQLLDILRSNLNRENQKTKIKALNGGKTYAYMLTHVLPYLRGSATGTIYSRKQEQIIRIDTVVVFRSDTVYLEKEVVRIDTICPDVMRKKPKKPFIMAVKSNLLYDAALLPNLAVEIPFGRKYKWSVAIEGNWSWWNTNADDYYYHRIQIAGAELRRWLGYRKGRPLNGWYVGAYAYGGTYDIRLFTNKNSDYGQLSNWSYSGGLTAGYAMRISKRFNLEFGLNAGYLGGKYYKYNVSDCQDCTFPKRSTHNRNYWGPTKLNVSLVWLIGKLNRTKKMEEL